MDEASTSALIPKTSVRHLINKLMVMCKKPSLESDLSGVLDEYLKKLHESQIYLSNGIFTTSFTEAALLIDNAVVLYGKKIDILWDHIFDYQKQMLSYERKTDKTREAELQLEERRQKYKRRKKKAENQNEEVMDEAAIDCLVEGVVKRLEEEPLVADLELTLEDDGNLLAFCDDICAKLLPKQTAAKPFAPYNRAGFVTVDYLIDCDVEDDEEFLCDNRYFTTERELFLLPEHVRQVRYNFFKRRDIELVGYDVYDKLLQQFIVEKNVTNLEATRDMSLLISAYIKLHLDLRRTQDASLVEEHKKLSMRRSSILLTRLPDDVVQQYLKNDDGDSSSDSQSENSSERQDEGEGKSSPGKDASKRQNNERDSGFFDGSFLDDDKTEREAADNDNGAEISFDRVLTSTPRSSSNAQTLQEAQTPSRTFELRPRKRKLQIDEDEDEEAIRIPKRVPRRGPGPFRWLQTTTVKLKTFERFYHFNYEPESGEGQIPVCEFSDSEPDEPDCDSDLPADNELEEQNSGNIPQDINEVLGGPSTSSAEVEAKSKPVDYHSFLLELNQARQAEQAPFLEWKDFIEKKLASRDKKEFDIHKFGTDILNGLPETEPMHFKSLMKGKKSTEVVRCFIASLQLANTYNIELIHSNDGTQLQNDDLKLKLLSKERYHENLSAYHAPSEVNLPKKLAKMRALSMSLSTSAAASFSKGCKRRKLNC